jgi:hypothetical protein
MTDFINQVQRIVVQQPDYTGMGGHDVLDHGGHGPHRQVDIGVVGNTINFRYPANP